jgi:isocitrate dehydrogenase
MAIKTPITVAYGDGIGPEIMQAVLAILEQAGASIAPEVIDVGKKVYLAGNTTGIPDAAWASLQKTKVLLKSPITTPQGGGYKSLNVTLRKTLGLYANVRPCVALSPYVPTHFPNMDVVIVRENEEDLYAGIEHRQTQNVYQCLKLISRPGCERIVHYAFEYARKFNRKKVTCFSKDNIMKMTDGIFHQVFNEIAQDYPDIASDHYIIDIGTALLATDPERFDVIVTSNLYGDIISDVAAQVVGSVGMAGSSNVGDEMAMFEAIHGSAPDIAGKGLANPSGLLNGAVQMLIHINQPKVAECISNAWLKTLEDGIHTADIFNASSSLVKASTDDFAQAVIARLGQDPKHLAPLRFPSSAQHIRMVCVEPQSTVANNKRLIGVDVFLDNHTHSPEALGEALSAIGTLPLIIITSRGVKVWPERRIQTVLGEHCRCRFQLEETAQTNMQALLDLQQRIVDAGFDIIKTENLYMFGSERGFSLAQGQ